MPHSGALLAALSASHVLIVLIVALVIFGASRLGQVGKGLGDGIRNFKKGLTGEDDAPPAPRPPEQLTAQQPVPRLEADEARKDRV